MERGEFEQITAKQPASMLNIKELAEYLRETEMLRFECMEDSAYGRNVSNIAGLVDQNPLPMDIVMNVFPFMRKQGLFPLLFFPPRDPRDTRVLMRRSELLEPKKENKAPEVNLVMAVISPFSAGNLMEINEQLQTLTWTEHEQKRISVLEQFYGVTAELISKIQEMYEPFRKSHFRGVGGDNIIYLLLDRVDYDYIADIVVDQNVRDGLLGKYVHRTGNMEDPDGINAFRHYLEIAESRHASDIHFVYSPGESFVQIRLDGSLINLGLGEQGHIPDGFMKSIIGTIKSLAGMKIERRVGPQDGRITLAKYSGREIDPKGKDFALPERFRGIDLRISSIELTQSGESVVCRLLYRNQSRDISELGYPKDVVERVRVALSSPYGLYLMVGPTGSGKSTTLYGMMKFLKEIHGDRKSFVTIENPPEFAMEGVKQIEVGPQISFAGALRSVLRQDPDIILVGEIRDDETAEVALNAALTGHTVLTTLHTNSAVGAVSRLKEIGEISDTLIADTLACSVYQRLARQTCPHCQQKYNARQEMSTLIGGEIGYDIELVRPLEGNNECEICHGTGVSGRFPVVEAWIATERQKSMIRDGKFDSFTVAQDAVSNGMRTAAMSAIDAAFSGRTCVAEFHHLLPLSTFLEYDYHDYVRESAEIHGLL